MSSTTRLEAEAQATYAEAFRDHPDIVIPAVVAVGGEALVTEWLDSPHSLAHIIREGTQAERDHYGQLFVRFLFEGPRLTGMLHADPHPGNFRILPGEDGGPGRLGVLDFGAVARLPGGQLPEAMGRLMRVALDSDPGSLVAGLREEGFIKDKITVDPDLVLDFLAPFVVPASEAEFTFTREWMREQFERVNDPRSPTFVVATRLNLPSSYLLIHRTWLGAIGLLSQLGRDGPVPRDPRGVTAGIPAMTTPTIGSRRRPGPLARRRPQPRRRRPARPDRRRTRCSAARPSTRRRRVATPSSATSPRRSRCSDPS